MPGPRIRVFELDGSARLSTFLVRVFHKLLINSTWWIDNKDHGDNNLFQGGFMGLDNISPIDRVVPCPSLGYLEQADSTAWMAMYALDLLDMALRLAAHDIAYEDVATKFFEHFHHHRGAADSAGLWDGRLATTTTCSRSRRVSMCRSGQVAGRPGTGDRRADATTTGSSRPAARLPAPGGVVHGEQAPVLVVVPRPRVSGANPPAPVPSSHRNGWGGCWPPSSTRPGCCRRYGIRAVSAWHRDHPFRSDGRRHRDRRLRAG